MKLLRTCKMSVSVFSGGSHEILPVIPFQRSDETSVGEERLTIPLRCRTQEIVKQAIACIKQHMINPRTADSTNMLNIVT